MQWGEGKGEHEGGEPGLPPSRPERWGALSRPQEGPYYDWALGASCQPACEGPGRSPPGEAKPFLTGTPLLSPQSFAGATSSAHSFVNGCLSPAKRWSTSLFVSFQEAPPRRQSILKFYQMVFSGLIRTAANIYLVLAVRQTHGYFVVVQSLSRV